MLDFLVPCRMWQKDLLVGEAYKEAGFPASNC